MKKIGIIICGRYQTCGGGKCFRALEERVGGFSVYADEEDVRIVGYSTCGGCPGGNVEYVPEEMIRNGAEAIHFATGFVVGYPPCTWIREFKSIVETKYKVPVIVGTHPIPQKYSLAHSKLDFWEKMEMEKLAPLLFNEKEEIMRAYD